MFKKFNPKEDIASSTSIKTSIQRTIRSKLLLQIPLLSAPALPVPKSAKSTTVDSDDDSAGSGEEEEGAGPSGGREFGGGKKAKELRKEAKGRGPGKGKDAKKARKAAAEAEEVEESVEGDEEEDVLTLLDVLWPKKEGLTLIKCRDHISILALHGEPLFFQHFDGPYYPTLKILHRYPTMLPHVQVDRGAIKFVLAGANIMCPGLTSASAALPESVPAGTAVAVHAAGKEMALGIGITMMSTDDIKGINKGCGVETRCYLGDDLWTVGKL